MRRVAGMTAWILCGMLAATSLAQEAAPPEQPDKTPIPTEGFWPTRLMVDRMLDRIVDEMSRHYDMDPEQSEQIRVLMKEQIPQFMDENRGEIQTLMNQFIEAQLAGEPPEIGHVAHWAQRAMPLLEKLTVKVGDMTDQMKEFMTDDQILKMDGELAAFYTGVKFASNKLGMWAEGGYDPETEWINDPRERRRRDRAEEAKIAQQMEDARQEVLTGEPAAAAAVPVGAAPETQRNTSVSTAARPNEDEFDRYTQEFIRRYDLNEDQKGNAQRFCEARKKERDDYLLRRKAPYEKAKEALASAKNDEEKQRAQKAFDRVNAPVERIFQKLKDSLDRVPTNAQRVKAAENEAPKPSAEPKGAGEGESPKP